MSENTRFMDFLSMRKSAHAKVRAVNGRKSVRDKSKSGERKSKSVRDKSKSGERERKSVRDKSKSCKWGRRVVLAK